MNRLADQAQMTSSLKLARLVVEAFELTLMYSHLISEGDGIGSRYYPTRLQLSLQIAVPTCYHIY